MALPTLSNTLKTSKNVIFENSSIYLFKNMIKTT